ncbi:hypothetical protein [Pedosphaera parvula]|uniref:IRE (Iron responsive element)-like protein n=1 Tax=Pedosphaera parvula (strain Ellin514) TaxID=320771 RepID=B9XHC0_PEDPL|nr:hypothetical protein [Pedosphaera parvula]EEF60755.1 hypothetical protein Cflav_PD3613 [Pedosphaera parvula Ellin514]
MSSKVKKIILGILAVLLLVGVSQIQNSLNRDRDALGLNAYTELKGAPPVLALTTVALGGFRGLISNVLWIRANDMQDDGKYFEMVQLADWITKLEPHFTQVWLVQAWNMAYNISVKFTDAKDRWRWVQRGIELLRDDGLRYNPHELLMYRELAWFFQHKMGQNLDDAHMYYKQMWANEMYKVFGVQRPNWDELIDPKTPEQKERSRLLQEKFKMDPKFMKEVDEKYGPLEWRMPEASAIYWAAQGLDHAKKNEKRISQDDLITLRRVIYQSMQMTFQRGRMIPNLADKQFEYAPNLDIIPHVNGAYEQAEQEDEKNRDHIMTAHRNLLRDVVFFLYTYNRQADAAKWFKYMCDKFPNKPLLDGKPGSLPGTLSLEDYALGRIQEEVDDPGMDKVKAVIQGLLRTGYSSLAIGEDDRFVGLRAMALKIYDRYQAKVSHDAKTMQRVGLSPFADLQKDVLNRLLNGEMSPELANQLRTKLNLPAAAEPAKPATEAPVEAAAQSPAPAK